MDKIAILKVSLDHPKGCYRIGRYLVGKEFAAYALNDAEWKELETDGCKRWLVQQADAVAPKPALDAPKQAEKKPASKTKGKWASRNPEASAH